MPQVTGDEDLLQLSVSITEPPHEMYYTAEDVVAMEVNLLNQGSTVSIEHNPSCILYLKVYNDDNTIRDDSNVCRNQIQTKEITSGDTESLGSISWDLKDENSNLVPSGTYQIQVWHGGTSLFEEVSVFLQTQKEIPDQLELWMNTTTKDESIVAYQPVIVSLSLHNPTNELMILSDAACRISEYHNTQHQLLDSCFPQSLVLQPFEVRPMLQKTYSFEGGENTLEFTLGDRLISISEMYDVQTPELLDDAHPLQLEFTTSIIDTTGMKLDGEVSLINEDTEDLTVEFSDTCILDSWLVGPLGNVIYDSLSSRSCNPTMIQYSLEANGGAQAFQLPEVPLHMPDNCGIPAGEYTLILSMDALGIWETFPIELDQESGSPCNDNIVIDYNIENDDNLANLIYTASTPQDSTFFWSESCKIQLLDLTIPDEEVEYRVPCFDEQIIMHMPAGQTYSLENFALKPNEGETLWNLNVIDNFPVEEANLVFYWPVPEATEDLIEDIPESFIPELGTIQGSWQVLRAGEMPCWILSSTSGSAYAFNQAIISNWSPIENTEGTYNVEFTQKNAACAEFDVQGVIVTEVLDEKQEVIIDENPSQEITNAEVETTQETLDPMIILVSTATTGGILGLVGFAIMTNESWRIPLTSGGLWFMGLLGRTKETTDGRYQRGRLMGYLTANPGCHFRALMHVLDMSNGQITHHLKILENECRIWRFKDGRLVRYYPYTSDLHPGTDEANLPLPSLSPDKNSLQGKILNILELDGELNLHPTQSELAKRLEKSQQLISHHLRTLQKYGLIEKEKSGLKNRYKLTKEAVFLLDSTDF